MKQVDDVLDAMAMLLGKPAWDTLPLDARLYQMNRALSDLTDMLEFTRRPVFIITTPLTLGGDGQPVSLPDDFGSVYLITTDAGLYAGEPSLQLEERFLTDTDFPLDPLPLNRVAAFEVRDTGDGPVIYGFPTGSAATNVVLHYRPQGVDLDLDSTVPMSARFHLNVLPLRAAVNCLPYATWDGKTEEGNTAYRSELLATLGPARDEATARYKNLIQKPEGNGGPEGAIGGFGASRNKYRFGS